MGIWIYTLVSVVFISLISLVGVFTLAMKPEILKKLIFTMVSFAVGGLLGDAFIHLIPESIEQLGSAASACFFVLVGIILFFVLEKFILWRHCHIPTSHEHPHPVVFMNIIGDAAHNMFDGLAIGASYIISLPVGIATTIAVILHEIPQEIGDFGILVHGGLSPWRALFFNLVSALFAVIGAVIALSMGPHLKEALAALLPITAGGFIYMAGSDLIPSLHDQKDFPKAWLQLVFMLFGISIMFLLRFIGE